MQNVEPVYQHPYVTLATMGAAGVATAILLGTIIIIAKSR